MKILFVINMLGMGGAERVAARLSSEWAKNNAVIIAKTSFSPVNSYEVNEKVTIVDLCKTYTRNKLKIIVRLRKLIKKTQPDVIVSFLDTGHFYTTIANYKTGIPHVCSERNNPAVIPQSKLLRFFRLFSFKRASGVVFQTNGASNFFSKINIKNRIIIKNPISARPVSDKPFSGKLISVGRLVDQKNYPLLIKSFSLVKLDFPNTTLSIYGDGPDYSKLNELIISLGLSDNVFLSGFSTDVITELSKSDIFIMASKHEGFPNALLEAISLGTPSISTDATPGGPRELLNGLFGSKLVESFDENDLAGTIKYFISNFKEIKAAALIDAKTIQTKYSIEEIASEWLTFFNYLINNKK